MQRLREIWPERAEPLVWEGIVLASWAGAKGGLGALKLAKQARDQLLRAEQIDPSALNGSVYTSLGSLYYQVPGWPLGFGDDDKAREYLEKALTMNPDGIDPNFFYGDRTGRLRQGRCRARARLAGAPAPGPGLGRPRSPCRNRKGATHGEGQNRR